MMAYIQYMLNFMVGFFFLVSFMKVAFCVKKMVCLIKIGYVCHGCVAPQFLEVIVLACVGCKDVDEGVTIVYHNPLGVAIAVIVIGFYV